MDLQERLADYIDGLETGIELYNEYSSTENSFSLYSRWRAYSPRIYGRHKRKELNFELQLKIKLNDRDKGYNALALISRKLEN